MVCRQALDIKSDLHQSSGPAGQACLLEDNLHAQAACHDIVSVIVTVLACSSCDCIHNQERIYQVDLADAFIALLQPVVPVWTGPSLAMTCTEYTYGDMQARKSCALPFMI